MRILFFQMTVMSRHTLRFFTSRFRVYQLSALMVCGAVCFLTNNAFATSVPSGEPSDPQSVHDTESAECDKRLTPRAQPQTFVLFNEREPAEGLAQTLENLHTGDTVVFGDKQSFVLGARLPSDGYLSFDVGEGRTLVIPNFDDLPENLKNPDDREAYETDRDYYHSPIPQIREAWPALQIHKIPGPEVKHFGFGDQYMLTDSLPTDLIGVDTFLKETADDKLPADLGADERKTMQEKLYDFALQTAAFEDLGAYTFRLGYNRKAQRWQLSFYDHAPKLWDMSKTLGHSFWFDVDVRFVRPEEVKDLEVRRLETIKHLQGQLAGTIKVPKPLRRGFASTDDDRGLTQRMLDGEIRRGEIKADVFGLAVFERLLQIVQEERARARGRPAIVKNVRELERHQQDAERKNRYRTVEEVLGHIAEDELLLGVEGGGFVPDFTLHKRDKRAGYRSDSYLYDVNDFWAIRIFNNSQDLRTMGGQFETQNWFVDNAQNFLEAYQKLVDAGVPVFEAHAIKPYEWAAVLVEKIPADGINFEQFIRQPDSISDPRRDQMIDDLHDFALAAYRLEDIADFSPKDLVHVPGKGWRIANWVNNIVFFNPEKDRYGYSIFNGRLIFKLANQLPDDSPLPLAGLMGLENVNRLLFGQEEGPVNVDDLKTLEEMFEGLRKDVQRRREEEFGGVRPVIKGMLAVPRGVWGKES